MQDAANVHSPEQIRNLFRKLRLCGPAWIDIPLAGISEAADMAEEFTRKYPALFWNTPKRKRSSSEDSFISVTIDCLKHGTLEQRSCAMMLIDFLEKKNVD